MKGFKSKEQRDEFLKNEPIQTLELFKLDVRTLGVLEKYEINYMWDLLHTKREILQKFYNFGEESVDRIIFSVKLHRHHHGW